MRLSELRRVTWDYVDFERGVIEIRQRADRCNKMGKPKSWAGIRTIPIAPLMHGTLFEWKPVCPKGVRDLIFPNGVENIETIRTFTIAYSGHFW